jgi:Domain of unknown function (DUF4382)
MMFRAFRLAGLMLAGSTLLALGACGGGTSGSTTGTLKLGVTDAPVDVADAVVVQFSGVELKPVNGKAFSIDFAGGPKTIDLLQQQGTQRAMLLDGEKVPAGDYEWMRLKVNADPSVLDSYVTVGGSQCEMLIPSGDETGLKLIRGFTVAVGTITDMTLDFDLRKSVVQPPGQKADSTNCNGQAYLLKPVLRVVDNLQVGTIAGTVDPSLVAAGSCPTSTSAPGNVYLFGPYTDTAPIPDDVDGNAGDGVDPITTAKVALDGNSNYTYTIGFVAAGKYIVAYTCDADDSTIDADVAPTPPATGETVSFTPTNGLPAEVTASQTTTVNFVAGP